MEDDLVALFAKFTTNDHESLVVQFSQILNTDQNIARFFLEASTWSVEKAVFAYLAEYSGEFVMPTSMTQQPPSVAFLSDLSGLQSIVFPPHHPIEMQWSFRNDGNSTWPLDSSIVWVDGERMSGFQSLQIVNAVAPGQTVTISQKLVTPSSPGTFMGTWRFCCSLGYFGDPVWVIVAVGGESPPHFAEEERRENDGMEMDML